MISKKMGHLISEKFLVDMQKEKFYIPKRQKNKWLKHRKIIINLGNKYNHIPQVETIIRVSFKICEYKLE